MIALSFYFGRRSVIDYRRLFEYTLLSAWILHMEWRTVGLADTLSLMAL